MFQPKVFSNRRPVKESADFKLTSTAGTIHISNDAMAQCRFRTKDCIVIAALPVETTGLTPTRVGSEEAFYLTKGFQQVLNAEGKVVNKQVGNPIGDSGNHNVISAANVYNELGGSTDIINNFGIGEAVYGFLVNEGVGTPITKDSAEDAGRVWAQVAVTGANGQQGLDFQEVADIATARTTGVPFFPLVWEGTSEKQIKASAGSGAAKAAKPAKAPAAPVQEVELDDFDA